MRDRRASLQARDYITSDEVKDRTVLKETVTLPLLTQIMQIKASTLN